MIKSLQKKSDKLKKIVSGYGKVAVAFSSGVDSTLLLKIVAELQGNNTIALFCNSALQPPSVLLEVQDLIEIIGAELTIVESDILNDNIFCQNNADRCYHCKKKTYSLFIEKAAELGCDVLLDGTNLDDDDNLRPGALAVKELGVKTPLREAGFTKKDIRRLSKEFSLTTWNKHSASCLATRIQTDDRITSEKLLIVNKAEQILISNNFNGCRVRHCGSIAVIQLTKEDQIDFFRTEIHEELKKYLKIEGFKQVLLDLSVRESILI